MTAVIASSEGYETSHGFIWELGPQSWPHLRVRTPVIASPEGYAYSHLLIWGMWAQSWPHWVLWHLTWPHLKLWLQSQPYLRVMTSVIASPEVMTPVTASIGNGRKQSLTWGDTPVMALSEGYDRCRGLTWGLCDTGHSLIWELWAQSWPHLRVWALS